MSNEYKDWIADKIQEEVLERKLIDKVTGIWDECYVEGFKDNKPVRYYVTLTDEGWLCYHQEII